MIPWGAAAHSSVSFMPVMFYDCLDTCTGRASNSENSYNSKTPKPMAMACPGGRSADAWIRERFELFFEVHVAKQQTNFSCRSKSRQPGRTARAVRQALMMISDDGLLLLFLICRHLSSKGVRGGAAGRRELGGFRKLCQNSRVAVGILGRVTFGGSTGFRAFLGATFPKKCEHEPPTVATWR